MNPHHASRLAVAGALACGGTAVPPPGSSTPGTAAVSTIVPSETDARVPRVEEMLRGVPGLEVTRLPNGNYQLRIRGPRSIRGNPGDDNPLLVIDGIPIPNESIGSMLADLAPRDVARIEVLKDASATSMYGSRGANGVIVITTKRAR
jgi:TonB-dependent SusC/RagA subfamily outer membrane receptor